MRCDAKIVQMRKMLLAECCLWRIAGERRKVKVIDRPEVRENLSVEL